MDLTPERLQGLYEHSPWIVEQALARGPHPTLAAFKRACAEVLDAAGREAQLALIRAHPELGVRLAPGSAGVVSGPAQARSDDAVDSGPQGGATTHAPEPDSTLRAEPQGRQASLPPPGVAGHAASPAPSLPTLGPRRQPSLGPDGLPGKAAVLTAESTREQAAAGLGACSPEEYARLQQLNRDYHARFGWPFILAVRGPRGSGLSRAQIIETFARRLDGHPDWEFAECLRQIHRIAELRLAELVGESIDDGEWVWDRAEDLARHSDVDDGLTVTYLTPAHQACAQDLAAWMREAGFDRVEIDAVGNVVGVFEGQDAQAPRLLTGSHYDTVRHGGKYDGRLGVLVPMAVVRAMHAAGERPKHGLEVVAFAEEEGQRYPATFLAASALTGGFDPAWLDQTDAQGVTMREAMQAAGLPGRMEAIAALKRDPARYRGFVELHIEQGPVLDALNLPLGVVTSINGSHRYTGEFIGQASHAGTTPMGATRRDAATAAAELVLAVERIASALPGAVGTVGQLQVPNGSINVVPGRCRFSLDLRAPDDATRDRLRDEVLHALQGIAARRGLRFTLEPTLAAHAAPSHPAWQARWEAAVQSLGLPVFHLPSGAGHDAMKLHERLPQAMLFVRGGNAGISHNPLESITAHDAQLCVDAFRALLLN